MASRAMRTITTSFSGFGCAPPVEFQNDRFSADRRRSWRKVHVPFPKATAVALYNRDGSRRSPAPLAAMPRVPFDPSTNYYQILGVEMDAPPEEIQAAY